MAAIYLDDLRDVLGLADHAEALAWRVTAREFVLVDRTGSYVIGALRTDPDGDKGLVYDATRYGEDV